MNAQSKILAPIADVISEFFYTLFAPNFSHAFPEAWIEVVCIRPDKKIAWRFFSAHDLKPVIEYVVKMNSGGCNIYTGAALRHGEKPNKGRAGKEHFCAASHFWIDCDDAGVYERAIATCKEHSLEPVMAHITGTAPHTRGQIWFKSAQPITDTAELETGLTALRDLFDGDHVQNADRIMRVPGTVSFPSPDKVARGYVVELTTLQTARDAPTYPVEALCNLRPLKSTHKTPSTDTGSRGKSYADADLYQQHADRMAGEMGRLTDADIDARLARHANGVGENWHNDLLAVTDEMLKRGCDTYTIRRAIAYACKNGMDDRDIGPLIDKRWLASMEEGIKAQREARAEKKFAGAALSLTFFGEFEEKAKKRPILKGFLNRGENSALIGPPKSLKSGLMSEIALHCAAGIDWRGHPASERCGVVIFALERADLYRRRLDAYRVRDGFKEKLPIAVAGTVIDLLNPKCTELIVATVREAEKKFGCAVGLIVIDTFSKGIAAGGGDEDKAKDQNRVAANLRRVQGVIDVHIACVGHTGKDESRGARGSNAHLGDIDLMIQISGEKIKFAKVTAANDQPERVVAQFQAELVEVGVDEDGEVETVSIVSNEEVSSAEPGGGKLSDAQQAALEQLWECIADGETASRPNDVHVPPGAKGVKLTTWRSRLIARAIINPEGNPYEQFKRIHLKLAKLKKIGIWGEFVWPT
ncbi:AAA family ATPase [Bradyrhizobium sp. RDI18]|uniref:AAA family ATPase n=1 Tax=Bradyrhizobium sp. RDI18 TaxID=3367400 RepID=UPI003713BF82